MRCVAPQPSPGSLSPRAACTDVKGSHAVYVSQPQAVMSLIEKAAAGAMAAATK